MEIQFLLMVEGYISGKKILELLIMQKCAWEVLEEVVQGQLQLPNLLGDLFRES